MRRMLSLSYLKRTDAAIVDSALASAMNLVSALVIGVVYGVAALGEFSLVLVYSSFVYLFSYNFIIVPSTSKPWPGPGIELAQKVGIISVVAFTVLTLAVLVIDSFVLKFSTQNVFLTFIYIVSHNTFLTLRRILHHLQLAKYPTLIPFLILGVTTIFASLSAISYQLFILIYSLSFAVVLFTVLAQKPGRGMFPSLELALQFLKFSRWMAIGIWFQWLSGNLVQLLLQYHLGTESLGSLRILLSSFGFLSIYFQYQEIVLAREYRSEKNIRFGPTSVVGIRRYLVPIALIALCLPIYVAYAKFVDVSPFMYTALLYALYQFFVLISIIMRVYLRMMNDMLYSSIGYFAMVVSIVLIELVVGGSFQMITAAGMYLASISVMVAVLTVGLLRISNQQVER